MGQLHSLGTRNGAARRVVTSGAEIRAACPELGKARAACLYLARRQQGEAVAHCYSNIVLLQLTFKPYVTVYMHPASSLLT